MQIQIKNTEIEPNRYDAQIEIPVGASFDVSSDTLGVLLTVFNKFHRVARQIMIRHNDRATIEISDEYDVQDLLHAILIIHFDDIRDEEWTPSYAGGSVQTEILLKNEKIVIEVKKTRYSLSAIN